jgi:hypothetical protein
MQAFAYENARAAADARYAPGLPPPPQPIAYAQPAPAPHVPCGTNLLFGCAPNVAPVPCVSGGHHAAPALAPPPRPDFSSYYQQSYQPQPSPYARNMAIPHIAAPTVAPATFLAPTKPPTFRGSESDKQANGAVVQPSWTVDDKENKEIEKAKADWS